MGGMRLRAVVGSSTRLREEALAEVRRTWSGPVQVVTEPDDLDTLLYGLDAPPLFGEPPLVVLRASEAWVKSRQEAFVPQVERPRVAGAVVLVVPGLDQRWTLAKALVKANALVEAGPPDAKGLLPWLQARVASHPQGAQDPRSLAELLVERVGSDPDAVLNALEVVALYAGDTAMTLADGHAVLAGVGNRPVWDLTGAILAGEAGRALELLQSAEDTIESLLAALLSELRRLAACSESTDDREVAAWTGARGNLFYARRRAQELGRKGILRLMHGAILLQRRLRQGGADPRRECEVFVLHARWVIRGNLRSNPLGPVAKSR